MVEAARRRSGGCLNTFEIAARFGIARVDP